MCCIFVAGDTSALDEQGLSLEILNSTLSGQTTWELTSTPPRRFYVQLHSHLKRKRSFSKTKIGTLYTAIDQHFRSYRPDNAYRVIETMCKARKVDYDAPMTYYKIESPDASTKCDRHFETPHASHPHLHYQKRNVDRREARKDKKLIDLQKKFREVQLALETLQTDAVETQKIITQSEIVAEATGAQLLQNEQAISVLQEKQTDLTETVELLMEENVSLRDMVHEMEEELKRVDDCTYVGKEGQSDRTLGDFVVTTTSGKRYSNAVRELYYKLLSMQISPAKVSNIIKTVLKTMVPSVNVESIQLPKRSAAQYMRKAELPTLNSAHKATVLAHASHTMHMNTDGTTLRQQKLNSIAINNICLSVAEVPDGTADSVLEHVDRELAHLRDIAHKLRVPEANSINWAHILSSTSDGASTQKRFNKLVDEYRERDRQKFGDSPGETATVHIVQNFCGMHLGVNLRKAQNAGVRKFYREAEAEDDVHREYEPGDRFVHEFCKLFGKHGTPEYGHGVLDLPDFLTANAQTAESNGNMAKAQLYRKALQVKLHRQIGSRYFVTASNAARAFYLVPTAVEYIEELKCIKELNRLEKEVHKKLTNPSELAQLKLDGLFFYHVYADLMMLVKSTDLDKSVLDMNTHYLELKMSLQELSRHPEQALDPDYKVFPSETRLYAQSGKYLKLNHRKNTEASVVYERLLTSDTWDTTLLLPRVAAAASAMVEKLAAYKSDQLPGGIYWNPNQQTQAVLKELKPNNDICESLLGLNDWLTTPLVNAKQQTKTALIEAKKNKTMEWLDTLGGSKDTVINLAVAERKGVQAQSTEHEKAIQQKRIERKRQAMEKERQKALRAQAMLQQLEELPSITSEEELEQAIQVIEEKRCSTRECNAEKLKLVKQLIKRHCLAKKRKVLLSTNGKPKSFSELKLDFLQLLEENGEPPEKQPRLDFQGNPELLVGHRIQHKFMDDGAEQWFDGYVLAYKSDINSHEVVYTGDSEHYTYNLVEDLEDGSLVVL